MKKILVTVLCLVILASCRSLSTSSVQYNPNPKNINNPALVIKSIIEHQPSAYASMPNSVEIDDQCIKLSMTGTTLAPIPASSAWTEYICYKNIGKISLVHNGHDKLWIVKIDDLNGNYMYWVYSFQRTDAEQFMDAISSFVKVQAK